MSLKELESRHTSRTVQWLEEHTGFSDQDVGEIFGVGRRTVLNWKSGDTTPQKSTQPLVSKLQQLRFLIDEVFETEEQFEDWLLQPSAELNGKPPREAIREGDIDPLLEILSSYYNGAFV